MTGIRLTHIGGPTVLIEVDGWRLLTDPTFDPPGGKYGFGWGTASVKLTGPAISREQIEDIDAVLLSHDHHGDNLDAAGRAVLTKARAVVTTAAGAKRLGGEAQGLKAWDRTSLEAPGRGSIEITATPCRHGPPLSLPLAGPVVGFALRRDDAGGRVLWISGDTVLYRGVHRVADRFRVDTALLHLGGVRFPITGPVRYSMTARDAVELCVRLRPRVAIPIHYEGWAHFQEPREAIDGELSRAPDDVRRRFRFVPIGVPTEVEDT